jgi:acetoacetyl-CoA synthetase
VVENMEEIADSVIVGKQVQGDEQVVLFVKLAEGVVLDDELIKRIRTIIRSSCSPRHVPAIIKAVKDVPYTLNGKKVEVAVKKIIHGEDVLNRDALKNPESLDEFVGILA